MAEVQTKPLTLAKMSLTKTKSVAVVLSVCALLLIGVLGLSAYMTGKTSHYGGNTVGTALPSGSKGYSSFVETKVPYGSAHLDASTFALDGSAVVADGTRLENQNDCTTLTIEEVDQTYRVGPGHTCPTTVNNANDFGPDALPNRCGPSSGDKECSSADKPFCMTDETDPRDDISAGGWCKSTDYPDPGPVPLNPDGSPYEDWLDEQKIRKACKKSGRIAITSDKACPSDYDFGANTYDVRQNGDSVSVARHYPIGIASMYSCTSSYGYGNGEDCPNGQWNLRRKNLELKCCGE
jgi:hypothetical protein